MSKVVLTTRPGRRTLSEKPTNLTVGTEITNIGKPWQYAKGDTTKRGKTAEEDMAGTVVKANTKFVLDYGELAEDLKGSDAKKLKAAGIIITAKGEMAEVSVEFPNSSIGIADGKYFVK